jgi:hypothetical protein
MLVVQNYYTMTGGIGFSRQGSDSFKQNRALRNKRKSMTDNPYSINKTKNDQRRGNFDLQEIQNYKAEQLRRSKSRANIIRYLFIAIFVIILLFIFI